MVARLVRAVTAAVGAAVVVLLIYVVVDLYMSGHGKGWSPDRGDPWYYHLFTVLMFAAAIAAGLVSWRRR